MYDESTKKDWRGNVRNIHHKMGSMVDINMRTRADIQQGNNAQAEMLTGIWEVVKAQQSTLEAMHEIMQRQDIAKQYGLEP